jgi:hypothetical protein
VTLKTEAKLLEICDAYASGFSYNTSAKFCGVSPRTLFSWLKASNSGEEDFIITYCDEQMQFAQAMALARKMVHMEVRANLERRSMLGHDEKVFFQGLPTWVEDERCAGMDLETRLMLDYPADGLLRDERGFRVQHTIHHEPPIAAALRVLEMSFGEEYTPSLNQNIINKDTGVLQALPITGDKIAVPPKPVRPEALSAPVDEPGDFEELLGPEPQEEPVPDDEPPAPAPGPRSGADPSPIDPGPRISEPTPPGYAPAVNSLISPRSLSPLELDLLRRKDAPPEVRSAPVSPGMANR